MLNLFFLNKFVSQLWLDRTCLINLNINSTICENLHQYKNIEDIVQKEVSRLNIAGSYIQTVPSIIISLLLGNFQINFCSLYKSFPKNLSNHIFDILANFFEFGSSLFRKSSHKIFLSKQEILLFLGPLSDHGRKLLLFLPFVGHLLSGGFMLIFLYFNAWQSQMLWISNIYYLTGGSTVLQIGMYGYIGDVTTAKYLKKSCFLVIVRKFSRSSAKPNFWSLTTQAAFIFTETIQQ